MKAETGWNLEIISGLEEGRLIHLGVMGLADRRQPVERQSAARRPGRRKLRDHVL